MSNVPKNLDILATLRILIIILMVDPRIQDLIKFLDISTKNFSIVSIIPFHFHISFSLLYKIFINI